MYRYIALLGAHRIGAADGGIDEALRSLGLNARLALDDMVLYASADTPVLALPSGALIGHAFSPSGAPVNDAGLPDALSGPELAGRVLERYWGEYLLLHAPDGADATTVLRDPSGGVGCVYSQDGGFITSDISIATRIGLYARQIDWDFIRSNLAYPHLKAGRTGLCGLRELLPGCRLSMRGEQSTIEQGWSPWDFVASHRRHRDRREAEAEVRAAVMSTVHQWADTDAAVLLELSGGLDSSIVAACLQDTHARVACCNLVTPVPGADERRYALQMSDLLRTELHVRTLGFDDAHLDSPPPPHAVAPGTWFLQHASNALKEAVGAQLGVNSFFSGGGGDTVFCYTRTAAPAADAFRERGMAGGIRAIHDLAELHQCTVWKAGRLTLKKLFSAPRPPRKAEGSFLAAPAPDLLEPHPWFAAPDDALPGDRERIFDLAGTQVFRDGLARGAKWQLRMPLLSQPVVEACLKVPSWMWIADGRNRAIARDAFADILPGEILHRRSKGTFMNYSGAFYRKRKRRIREYLLTGRLQAQGLLDTDALQRCFDRELAPRDDAFMRIFDLCAVENWVRHQG